MGCASSTLSDQFLDIKDGMHDEPENGVQIMKFYYFEDAWGRKSALEFMMDHAGLPFTVERIHPIKYFTGLNKKMGGLPVAERSDGKWMHETHPMARYIARHKGYYPTDPLECYYCDMYTLVYDPIINLTFQWIMAAKAKTKLAIY